MPVRPRQPNELTQQMIPLLLLGVGLVTTNNSVTFLPGEATLLGAAVRPLRTLLAQFFSGNAHSAPPPLYSILMHFWLSWTDGNFDYLRIPSVFFFLGGLFLLGRATRHLSGSSTAAISAMWLGVLWPLGFHYGRLATPDSFSFLLVAGLTLAYFKCLEDPRAGRWAALFLFSAALIWTSYFGWFVLACLAVDQMFRARAKEPSGRAKIVLGTAVLLCLVFLPLVPALRSDFSARINLHQSAAAILANTAFHIFSLFVSVSIAPWDWRFSLPLAIAILVCLGLAGRWVPPSARRFLYYSGALIVLMTLAGTIQLDRLFLISPWVLLPVGMAIDATKPRWATFTLAVVLLAIGGAGWFGIYSRRYYSMPQFLEPWRDVAGDAALKIGGGSTVIADHPSFLLYLTYLLHVPRQNGPWRLEGLLPETVRDPRVFSSTDWLAAGHPASGEMMLIRGGAELEGDEPIDQVARQLDQSCGSISSRLRMRDGGYKWKQRFFPQLGEPQWRIEVREYDCESTNSKQIYPIPPRRSP